jgi:hypothetical protein
LPIFFCNKIDNKFTLIIFFVSKIRVFDKIDYYYMLELLW